MSGHHADCVSLSLVPQALLCGVYMFLSLITYTLILLTRFAIIIKAVLFPTGSFLRLLCRLNSQTHA